MVHSSEKAEKLVLSAKNTIENWRSGVRQPILGFRDLAEQSGYHNSSNVRRVLKEAGILDEYRDIFIESRRKILAPSVELSWLLGAIAGRGVVKPEEGVIALGKVHKKVREKFADLGGSLFEKDANYFEKFKNTIHEYKLAYFHDVRSARELGALKVNKWPSVLQEKHSWLYSENQYLTSFVTGFFDTKGVVSTERIDFNSIYPEVSHFMIDILIRMGVGHPLLIYRDQEKQRIGGVLIANRQDQKFLAEKIHSSDPEKEAILEFYRKIPDERIKKRYTDEELISEWMRIYQMLGKIPKSSDINYLYYQRQTRWPSTSYMSRFGLSEEYSSGRSYIKARNYLISTCLPNLPEETVIDGMKRKGVKFQRINSKKDLISAYKIARAISLKKDGRLPTSVVINDLRRSGVVRWSPTTLANYFGNGSFTKARETLESILAEEAE